VGGLENRVKTPIMPRVTTSSAHRRIPLLLALLALLGGLWLAAGAARAATVTVAPGDTLSAIAARNGTSAGAIARANGIADPDLVRAGTRLTIPSGGAAAVTPASASGGSHRVRPGDTLGAIAARHGVSVASLASANGISDPDVLSVGRTLTIPSGGGSSAATAVTSASSAGASYRVRTGDTLGAIAARHGTSVAALAGLNGIADPGMISVGRVLSLPAASAAAPVAVSAPTSSSQVADLITRHSARYGVDASLARAIAWQESGWTQSARSSVGAVGVMQLMPDTARWLGSDVIGRRLDPERLEDNIEGGVAYLGWLGRHAGDTRTAIGAYYQGLSSLRHRGPYDDTKAYVANVLSLRGRV
jgi:LysM repeat protein